MSRTKNFFFSLLPALGALAVNLIVSMAGTIVVALQAIQSGSNLIDALWSITSGDKLAGLSMVYAIIVIVLMGIWYYKRCYYHSHSRIDGRQRAIRIGGLILLVIGLYYLISYLLLSVELLLPDLFTSYEDLIGRMDLEESVIIWVYSLLFAPVCEELVFRGVTMHYASRTMTFWGMNIFQSVLFGLFHGNLIQGIYAFVLGLVLGYIRYYGGLGYSIITHMCFNFMNIPAGLIENLTGAVPTAFYLLIIGISMTLSIVGICIFASTSSGSTIRPYPNYHQSSFRE
jgi:hypothetical protein